MFGFKKRKKTNEVFLTLQLNAKLQPVDREERYEKIIDEVLRESNVGRVDGGGTLLDKNSEFIHSDVDIVLYNESLVDGLMAMLLRLGIPKGSFLHFGADNSKKEIGTLEGLAVYLNGTELSAEVYKTSDVNKVIEELNNSLNGVGSYYSFWRGETETALYFYGESFDKMKSAIAGFLSKDPLCQKCRIVQIA